MPKLIITFFFKTIKSLISKSQVEDGKTLVIPFIDASLRPHMSRHHSLDDFQGVAARKSSECQTDPAEGVDFDWDLTDKTDIETQTVPPSRDQSAHSNTDAIVQTDQRIVFHNREDFSARTKKVTFDLDDDACEVSVKHAWSQTKWDVEHKGVQVVASELEPLDREEWSANGRQWRRSKVGSGPGDEEEGEEELADANFQVGSA